MKKKWQKHSISEKLLTIWQKSGRFVSNAGLPLDLPVEPQEDGPSFTELVQLALPGKMARHVLKELRRRGLVEQLADEIIRYRPKNAAALGSTVTTDALEYAADQQSLLGQTLLQSIARATSAEPKKDFRAFVASATVEIPLEDIQASRLSVLQRMATLAVSFERECGRKAHKAKTKKTKSTAKVGIGIYTWQIK